MAKFVIRDDENSHQASRNISKIIPILYHHIYNYTEYLDNGITPMYVVQLKMAIFQWESSNKKYEKSISADEVIIQ